LLSDDLADAVPHGSISMLEFIGNMCQVVAFLSIVTGLSRKPVILALPAERQAGSGFV
jgi:hypothetical protein